jgi:hypothetical protein
VLLSVLIILLASWDLFHVITCEIKQQTLNKLTREKAEKTKAKRGGEERER